MLVVPPGVLINVHVPADGKPFNTTLPVDIAQVGWVMVPNVGAVGEVGGAATIASADTDEVQPEAFVTV